MSFESSRERWLWLAALAWVVAIYSTLYVARPAAEYLRDRNLLRLTVWVVVALLAAAIFAWGVRRRLPPGGWAILAAGAVALLLGISRVAPAEVKLHFVEYGVLGGLFYLALAERGSRLAAPLAVLLTVAVGWLDEGIQYLLPNRWYDTMDVVINGVAGAIAVTTLALLRRSLHPRPHRSIDA